MVDDNYTEKFIQEVQKDYGSIENYRKACMGDWDEEPLEEKGLRGLEIKEIVVDEATEIIPHMSVEQLQRLLDRKKPRKIIQFDNGSEVHFKSTGDDDDASF